MKNKHQKLKKFSQIILFTPMNIVPTNEPGTPYSGNSPLRQKFYLKTKKCPASSEIT